MLLALAKISQLNKNYVDTFFSNSANSKALFVKLKIRKKIENNQVDACNKIGLIHFNH